MTTFDVGETVICSITVKTAAGVLTDPTTSMNIIIDRTSPVVATVVSSSAMTKDSTGTYHYDFQSATFGAGDYKITYIATDGTRITHHYDTFRLS